MSNKHNFGKSMIFSCEDEPSSSPITTGEKLRSNTNPWSWITLRLQGLTFIIPKLRILEVSKSIKSRGFCLLDLEKNMLGYIIVIDPTQIWGPHNAFFKSLASALPEGQAKLRWSGIPNGYLCGLLKLHLYLSRTGTWICGPCCTQHCYPKLSTLIWNDTNCLEIGIHTTCVSFIHGELVMQFMFVMLVKQHGNHLGISCDCWVLQICQANSPLLSQKLALFTVFWIGLATVQVACIHIVNTSGSNALQCWLANVMWDVKFLSFSYINS